MIQVATQIQIKIKESWTQAVVGGSVGKGTCHQAWPTEVDLQDPMMDFPQVLWPAPTVAGTYAVAHN